MFLHYSVVSLSLGRSNQQRITNPTRSMDILLRTKKSVVLRPAAYPVPFIAIARDGSNFPGEKMSALLLSIPQWDSIYTC